VFKFIVGHSVIVTGLSRRIVLGLDTLTKSENSQEYTGSKSSYLRVCSLNVQAFSFVLL
jgi:hypothetical protein